MVDLDKDTTQKYQDLITFKPHLIMDIDNEQRYLINQHYNIINGLRRKNLTVKELHGLYFVSDKSKHSKTLKTIYRYLDELEKNEIVSVAGQRMTVGSRITEKVYCLTAKYFHDAELGLPWWQTEDAKDFTKTIGVILSEVLKNPKFKEENSIKTIHQLCKLSAELDYFNILEILENLRNKPDLEKIVADKNFDDQTLITYASQLIVLLRNFDLISQLKIIDEGHVTDPFG